MWLAGLPRKSQPPANKAAFQALLAQKAAIEAAFGRERQWQELPHLHRQPAGRLEVTRSRLAGPAAVADRVFHAHGKGGQGAHSDIEALTGRWEG